MCMYICIYIYIYLDVYTRRFIYISCTPQSKSLEKETKREASKEGAAKKRVEDADSKASTDGIGVVSRLPSVKGVELTDF